MAVEEPTYRLRRREGRFEVRDYPALVVAEVTVTGDQGQAANRGFRVLAGYIFGGNRLGQKIAMTAPVTLIAASEKNNAASTTVGAYGAGEWVVRFTMPKVYAIGALSKPADDRVRLRVVPPTRFAVVRFTGFAHPAEVRAKSIELGAWVRVHHLRPIGPSSLAQYDPPWTLWFMRRNEVMIPVAG